MKVKYNISGISCSDCASKLESKVKAIDYVDDISINVVTGKMVIVADEQNKVLTFIQKEEPNIQVEEDSNGMVKSKVIVDKMIITVIILIVSFFVDEKVAFLLQIGAYILIGYEIFFKAIKNILEGSLFDEFFLMTLATLAAILIKEPLEAVLVMLLYTLGEFFQEKAIVKSRNSVKELLESNIKEVEVVSSTGSKLVLPEDLEVGEVLNVKGGEKIPVDCVLLNESAFINTSAITGESVAKEYLENSEILAGMIVENQSVRLRVIRKYDDSAIAKMLTLVEDSVANKPKIEKFITKFSKVYTPTVVILAILLVILLPQFGYSMNEAISRAIILLVISCPCALVISVPLGYFMTTGASTANGVLIKGAQYVDVLGSIETLVVDKTGTLTKGNFEIDEVYNYSTYSDQFLFEVLYAGERNSKHPIAISICRYYKEKYNNNAEHVTIKEIEGKGISYQYETFNILVGNKNLLEENNIEVNSNQGFGSGVYLALNNKHVFTVVIKDQIKENTYEALENLRKEGVKSIIMLTGDTRDVAKSVSEELGIDKYYYELLPAQKVSLFKEIKSESSTVGYVGDGINDAPVLALADVAVAMGNVGSDIAIENADVIINNDSLLGLYNSVLTAKKGRRIVLQNIVFALVIKGIFITFGVFGEATMLEAIFADVGVTLLAILNCIRILR